MERLPVEAALDHIEIALGESLRARLRTNRIGRLIDEQRLIAGHEIDSGQWSGKRARQVLTEIFTYTRDAPPGRRFV